MDSKDVLNRAARAALIEPLEQRQYMSASSDVLPALHTDAPAANEVMASATEHKATLSAHRQAVIAKSITNFEKTIRNEVHHNLNKADNVKFQNHIALQQANFAKKIAREGGSYTPIPFSDLLVGTAPLVAPTLTATSTATSSVNLSWSSVSGATKYTLQTSLNGANWTTIATQTTTTYVHSNLAAGSTHKYRVNATVGTRATPQSTTVTTTTLLAAPIGFSAITYSATRIDLSWVAYARATGYKIERSLNGTAWTALSPNPLTPGTAHSFSDTSAAAGTTYYYRLSAISTTGTSATTAVATAITPPGAPVLTATSTSATAGTLSWPTVTGATSYQISLSTDGGNTFSAIANQSTLTYALSGLTPDSTTKYHVVAMNAAGSSAPSNTGTVTTLLAAPSGLAATPLTTTTINVSWNPTPDVTTYKVERSTNQTTWTALSPSPTGSAVSVVDTVSAGTLYYYRISSISSAGTSAISSSVTALTLPVAPTLTATTNSASQITLNWAAVTGATSYLILRSLDGGVSWSTLASPTTLTYANTGLTADTSYEYIAYAINGAGVSAASNAITNTTLLAPPTGVNATAVSATSITLGWNPVPDATNYKIERSPDQKTWTTLAPSPALNSSSVFYTDSLATAGATFYYRISSIEAAGTSAPSAIAHALTLPAAPATLTASVASSSTINLTWTTVPFATGYKLETSLDAGVTWNTLTTQTGVTYSNTNLIPNTSYEYRVSTTNATGYGAPTSGTTAVTLPVAPTGVSATASSASQTTVSWTPVIASTSYKIERSTDQITWTTLSPNPALTGGSSSYADTTASAGTTYYYRVSNITGTATSTPGPVVHALTEPAMPVLNGTAVSNTQVNLTWAAVLSSSSYLLESSADGGVSWNTLATPTGTSYSATGLTTDSTYQFRLTANNLTGSSSVSTVKTVTTLLPAPTGFTATVVSATSVTLNWTQVPDATGYKLERSTNQTTWTPTTIGSGSTVTSTDAGVNGGTNYYYRLSAIDAAGTSATTAVVHVLTVPASPTLAATAVSATQINLGWNTVTGANSYVLESSSDGGITWNTIASPVTTTFANAGLTTGLTYTYRVSAKNATGTSAPSATQATATLLTAPTGFAATSTSSTSITLTWNAVATASGYTIQRSTDQNTWAGFTPNPNLNGSAVTYTDSQAVAGITYYYRISTANTAGSSANSAVVHTITLPNAPTLTASVVSATQINLSWPAVFSAGSYRVDVSPDSGTTWTTLATVTTLNYADTGEAAGTNYTYRVSAFNASGAGAYSNEPTPTTLLAAPTGFTASAHSLVGVDLAWNVVTGATGYLVDRSTDGVTWTPLAPNPSLTGTSTSYTDSLAAAGTNYYYKINAIEAGGNSAFTPVAQALTYAATPTVLTGTATSATSITLNWTAMKGASQYLLETSPDGSTSWTTVIQQAGTSYANTGLTTDTEYFYRVSAINASGTSAVTASAVGVSTLLLAPGSPTASVASSSEIDLAWTTVTDATSYKIERSLDQNTWTTLAPNPALTGSSAAYADTTASAGFTYYYRISGSAPSITSAPGTVVHATTYPATPTLTASAASLSVINLSWTASARATGYYLETSSDGGTNWSQLVTSGTATTFANTGLAADTSYEYRVSAIDAGGTGATSNVATISTLLAIPTGFSDTAISASEVDLAWTAVTDATNYKIERSTNQTIWTTLSPNPALTGSSAAYADTTASAGINYYYRVSAIGANGPSTPTAAQAAMTLPATPTLSATATSATTISLSWTPVVGAATYFLEHSTDGGSTWNSFGPQAGTTLTDTALTANTSYEYRVTATDTTGNGVTSGVTTISTLLSPPTVTASAASAGEIDLTWPTVTNATGFKIERSLDQSIWLTVTPNPALSGSATGYNDLTVASGTTYYYRVSSIDAQGTSVPSTVAHALSYSTAPSLTATSAAFSTATLTWNAVVGVTNYEIERSSDGGTTWSAPTAQAANVARTFTDTGLTADTSYEYQIAAANATGTGAFSGPVAVTTLLAAPSGFTATGVASGEIDLAWTAETDATNYKIERSPNGTTLWSTITPAVPLTGASAGYADTTVNAGTTYYYRVSAIDAAGTSAPTTATSGQSLPAIPVLTATASSATSVALNWTAVTGATSYLVEASSNGGATWSTINTATTNSYTNTALTSDSGYEYRISGIDASGTGVASNVVSVTTLLAAPAGFTTTAALVSSGAEIDLAWTPVDDAVTYKVERSLTGTGAWSTISNTLGGATSSYADTTVLAGTTYYYRISAVDAAGTSAPATTAHALTYSAAPTLTGAVFSSTVINLTWNSSFGATSYLLERSADGGATWSTATSGAVTSYSNTTLTPDTNYLYRVSAINATGTGSPSALVPISTLLNAPTGLAATSVSSSEIDLVWNGVSDATGYLIERSLNNSVWTPLAPSPALTGASNFYADTTVASGTTYFYRISAIDAAGTSAPSTAINTIDISDAPVVTANAASDTEIDLTWNPILGAASYVVQASADGGQTWTVIATPTISEYANTALTGDTNYEYEVASVNAGGTSDESSIVTVTTLLSPVTNLAGTATSPTSVTLTWTAVPDATTYLIESSPDQQSWITLNTALTGTSATFVDTTVTAGSTTYYRITAINANGSSAPTAPITVITPLNAPVNLAATAVSTSQINLTWTADTDAGLLSFRLESSADGSTNWTAVATVLPTATSVSDIRLTTGTTYYYRLIAVSAGGDSAPSNIVHATTM
jgi:titin